MLKKLFFRKIGRHTMFRQLKRLSFTTIFLISLLSQPLKADPEFLIHKAIQKPNTGLCPTLSDIESHMTAGHQYRNTNYVTWGHETTHGINSLIRNQYTTPSSHLNAFYVLNDRAVVIDEPNCKITEVAEIIPPSLRYAKFGTIKTRVYQTYLVDSVKWWNDRPLYIFDEWVAYCNGTRVAIDLNERLEIQSSTIHMLQFNVFALSVAQTCKSEDTQFKEFLRWNLSRAMQLGRDATIVDISDAGEYWKCFQHNEDAENLRVFTRNYLGKNWTKKNLGI